MMRLVVYIAVLFLCGLAIDQVISSLCWWRIHGIMPAHQILRNADHLSPQRFRIEVRYREWWEGRIFVFFGTTIVIDSRVDRAGDINEFDLTDYGDSPWWISPPKESGRRAGYSTVSGWPLLSRHSSRYYDNSMIPNIRASAMSTAVLENTSTLFPIYPLWRGLFVNSLIYALALGVVLSTRRMLLRRSRVKRGCCVKCGYRLIATVAKCPECGQSRKRKESSVI